MKNVSVNEKNNKPAVKGEVAIKKGEGGIAFSLFMLLYFVVSLLVQGALLLVGAEKDNEVFNLIPSVVTYATCFVFLIVFCKRKSKNVLHYFRARKFSPLFAILSVTTAVGLLFGFGFVNGLVAELLKKIGLKTQSATLNFDGAGIFLAYVFALAILPAVVEETAFRGVVFGENLKCGTVFAVIFSSLAFALFHCSATQLLYQFLCGAVFCLLAYFSGSVIPSVIAHFANNFCVLLFSYAGLYNMIDFYSLPVIFAGFVVLFFSVFLTIVLGKRLIGNVRYSDDVIDDEKRRSSVNGTKIIVSGEDLLKKDKKRERKYFFLFASAGFALCLTVLISGLFA